MRLSFHCAYPSAAPILCNASFPCRVAAAYRGTALFLQRVTVQQWRSGPSNSNTECEPKKEECEEPSYYGYEYMLYYPKEKYYKAPRYYHYEDYEEYEHEDSKLVKRTGGEKEKKEKEHEGEYHEEYYGKLKERCRSYCEGYGEECGSYPTSYFSGYSGRCHFCAEKYPKHRKCEKEEKKRRNARVLRRITGMGTALELLCSA